eukprot:TRINITY_DN3775_c2_g3_i1.p1 TRINITY_DN3775_c2_g3~~TRINITY_DN3775_c2_g3_i1.p1  ORF type:complete len:561 (+),score=162.17 TRINITY_DN3775_c2_g3_i1:620-2302(+)
MPVVSQHLSLLESVDGSAPLNGSITVTVSSPTASTKLPRRLFTTDTENRRASSVTGQRRKAKTPRGRHRSRSGDWEADGEDDLVDASDGAGDGAGAGGGAGAGPSKHHRRKDGASGAVKRRPTASEDNGPTSDSKSSGAGANASASGSHAEAAASATHKQRRGHRRSLSADHRNDAVNDIVTSADGNSNEGKLPSSSSSASASAANALIVSPGKATTTGTSKKSKKSPRPDTSSPSKKKEVVVSPRKGSLSPRKKKEEEEKSHKKSAGVAIQMTEALTAAEKQHRVKDMAKRDDLHWQACIFKAGDDIRQDMLALQVMDLFKRIFDTLKLDFLYLLPYRVIATSPGCGVIECVPNARSRDQVGQLLDGSLFEYYQHKYGPSNSVEFQQARQNFLESMAAYSVVSFILQMKDRHNGNIMFNDEGRIIHIDFGFIFDISPGGNIKFELAPFKLSAEMIELLGGDPKAEMFKTFMNYCVRAYLAIRDHTESIVTLVSLMLDTQLPCFTEQTLTNLRARLSCGKTEKEAAKFMTYTIVDACGSVSTFTTYFYDAFQNWSNGIDY